MPKLTLDDIAQSINALYGSFEFEIDEHNTVELLHPIRLPKSARDELSAIAESDEDEDVEGRLISIIRTVAVSETAADKLLAAISPRGYVDLAMLGKVVGAYMEDQKVGEASASQD